MTRAAISAALAGPNGSMRRTVCCGHSCAWDCGAYSAADSRRPATTARTEPHTDPATVTACEQRALPGLRDIGVLARLQLSMLLQLLCCEIYVESIDKDAVPSVSEGSPGHRQLNCSRQPRSGWSRNRPGAGSNIATGTVAGAAPGGYTLLAIWARSMAAATRSLTSPKTNLCR